jgi:hypothetical protein
MFNTNTLKNTEIHLRKYHYLDEGGDIWRIRHEGSGIQASSIINRDYEYIIPFR